MTYDFKTSGEVGISDHIGKPNHFSSDCLVIESKKKKILNFTEFSSLNKVQSFSKFHVFNCAFTLSPLNGVSNRFFFLNRVF